MSGFVALGEVCEFIRNGVSVKQSDNAQGLPITRIETIANWAVNLEKCGYADVKPGQHDDYLLQSGDILVSHINSTKHLGKCALFESEKDVIHGMNLLNLRLNKEQAFPKYIYHTLCSDNFRRQIPRITKDSVNQSSFTVTNFKELEIPLPPLEEQKRIAAILDKADAIRRKRQQAIELADQFLRSVFLDMFGDPVTNPKGWELRKIGEVSTSRLGKMLDAKHQTGEYPRAYLRNPNVQWRKIVLDDLKAMDFSPKDQKEFSLSYGDVLICEGGEVGRAAIWRNDLEDCYFQKALHRVRPNSKAITSEYLCDLMWFYAHRGGLDDHVTSATIAHLTGVKLKNIEIPVPPLDLQKKYSEVEAKYRSYLDRLESAFQLADMEFGSLSMHAFSGVLSESKAA